MKLSEIKTMSDEQLEKVYEDEKKSGTSMLLVSLRVEMRRRTSTNGFCENCKKDIHDTCFGTCMCRCRQ